MDKSMLAFVLYGLSILTVVGGAYLGLRLMNLTPSPPARPVGFLEPGGILNVAFLISMGCYAIFSVIPGILARL